MQVRESQVEDILATYPDIAREILNLPEAPAVVARQLAVPTGRLDLLLLAGTNLLVVELKVEPCSSGFITQTKGYMEDVAKLQAEGKFPNATLEGMLLCPSFEPSLLGNCKAQGLIPLQYSPQHVLSSFFDRFVSLASFSRLKPSDHGLWGIHLINRALYALEKQADTASLAKYLGQARNTTANQLRFARDLCLVVREGGRHSLTELGRRYVLNRSTSQLDSHLSDEQTAVLRDFIVANPFATPTIYGVYAMVDVVFQLAKNRYPVPWDTLMPYFRDSCGKRFQWKTPKACHHGARMYANYCTELGLLGQVGHEVFLTPDGIRFILLLQLHKSIQMIDALGIRQ